MPQKQNCKMWCYVHVIMTLMSAAEPLIPKLRKKLDLRPISANDKPSPVAMTSLASITSIV